MSGHSMAIKILIECPACHQQHEIFLKKNVNAVILPCSECKSMISHSSGKTKIVKESLLKKIDDMKTVDDLKTVFDIIDAHIERALEHRTQNDVISEDDIINIRIALEHGDFWDKYLGEI